MVKNRETLTETFGYLDGLRESGVTNMFGARPYLEAAFPELDRKAAGSVLSLWMKTFDRETSVDARVDRALARDAE
jgi:hypothetical protein